LEHRGLAGILEISVNIGDSTIAASFGPEGRLILRCLRRDADSVANGAADTGADRIDWDRLTLSAGSHGVLPLVYRRLKSAGNIPPEALTRMRAEFYGNSLNNLHLARELVRLTGLLNARGIGAIGFKGPVLALMAWGDVALRQFNDLDLLVRPEDAASAADVLIAAGYWPLTFDREHPARSIARRCEDEFIRPGSPWMIDLHWELNPAYFCYGPGSAAIWDRAESIRVEGADVLTLAPEDLVLFLAVHGTKHGWINVGWVCDFDETMRAIGDADLPAILEAARRSGCLRMLLLAIALAADLLDAPIPPAFADALRRDRAVAPLVAGIERRLFASLGMHPRLYSQWVVPLRTIPGLAGRVRYVASRALTPNADDFDFLPLPPMLYPLYYAMRPFRLAWQQGRRLFVDVPHPLKRLRGIPR
jgi:Uncharacterised nucleotidyltransferase